jgi:hypothetical protein
MKKARLKVAEKNTKTNDEMIEIQTEKSAKTTV